MQMDTCPDVLEVLPTPLDCPRIYLSQSQQSVCQKHEKLKNLTLPGWVRQELIGEAFGYSHRALWNVWHSRGSWVWATEFENSHATWYFHEPRVGDGKGNTYQNAQAYYKFLTKDYHWLDDNEILIAAMKKAVTAKLQMSTPAREVLIASYPHELLCINQDTFWGYDVNKGGTNHLGKILMEVRESYVNPPAKRKNKEELLPGEERVSVTGEFNTNDASLADHFITEHEDDLNAALQEYQDWDSKNEVRKQIVKDLQIDKELEKKIVTYAVHVRAEQIVKDDKTTMEQAYAHIKKLMDVDIKEYEDPQDKNYNFKQYALFPTLNILLRWQDRQDEKRKENSKLAWDHFTMHGDLGILLHQLQKMSY